MLLAAMGAVATQSAMAAVDFSGGVSVGGQYDTNARQLARSEAPPIVDGESSKRDDVSIDASANVAARTGGEGPLRARVEATYTHSESMRQDSLSHDDYSVAANVDWRPGRVFDASLRLSQNRLPLGLADFTGEDSVPQTTQTAQATLRVRPTPGWQLSVTPGLSESRTSLEGEEDRRLREESIGASIDYLGAGRLVPGIGASQSDSTYSGVADATRFEQESVYGSLGYQLNEVTAFSLTVGKTWRTTRLRESSTNPTGAASEGKDSAVTGSLNFSRRLTAKTSVSFSAYRDFQVYDAGVNTSIGTGFSGSVSWAATARVSSSLTVTHAWSTIENVPLDGARVERDDLTRSFTLGATYLVSRLVSANANVTRTVRNSEIARDQYSNTSAGLSVSVQFD